MRDEQIRNMQFAVYVLIGIFLLTFLSYQLGNRQGWNEHRALTKEICGSQYQKH